MSAKKNKHGVNDGSAIFFLIKPFKWLLTIIILFSSLSAIAITSLMYFCSKKDLIILASKYIGPKMSKYGLEQFLGEKIYKFLSWFVFDLTKVQKILTKKNISPDDLDSKVQSVLVQNYDQFIKLDLSLQIISVRMGLLIAYCCTVLVIITLLALYDGLMARKIRTACLGRESSTMYHQAKFLRSGAVIFTSILFFSWPKFLDPVWLIVFGAIFGIFVWLQAKYYKKYI